MILTASGSFSYSARPCINPNKAGMSSDVASLILKGLDVVGVVEDDDNAVDDGGDDEEDDDERMVASIASLTS